MRAKIAKRRNKEHLLHLLSNSEKYNYHIKEKLDIENKICELMPNRRSWRKIGFAARYTKGIKINSIDKNIKTLITTIKWYESNNPTADFLVRLNEFTADVQNSINDINYRITKPNIIPKLKDPRKDSNNVCRPISNYNLKDKIIISLVNKYLTDLLDGFFYKNSLAFRAPFYEKNEKKCLNHHDSIKLIKSYIESNSISDIWVSECDMRKFFDTVDHKVIEKQFNKLMIKAFKKFPEYFDSNAVKIFRNYLDSYSFNHNVYPLNRKQEYFDEFGIPDGSFGWVEDELKKENYYKNVYTEKIGIPQGGALSGLIANIVLDIADRSLNIYAKSNDFLYLRYCDDMIILSTSKKDSQNSTSKYVSCLKQLRLVPHKFEEVESNSKEYWKTKSKAPYQWKYSDGIQWIGFVGYEINRHGFTRVRISSLKKEMSKQCKVIIEAKKAIDDKQRRASRGYIEESIIHRLIGMSIGRMSLWNYEEPINDLCWINGFTEINKNPNSIKQHKALDKNRNKHFKEFLRTLGKMEEIDGKPIDIKNSRQQIYYGKPFSYYYQAIEKTTR